MPGPFHGEVPGPVWPVEDSHSPWTGFRGPCQEYTDFYLALLSAKGIVLHDGDDDGGRELTYTAKVQSSGSVSVGRAYTSQLTLKPGDEVQIKVNANDLQLVPVPATIAATADAAAAVAV